MRTREGTETTVGVNLRLGSPLDDVHGSGDPELQRVSQRGRVTVGPSLGFSSNKRTGVGSSREESQGVDSEGEVTARDVGVLHSDTKTGRVGSSVPTVSEVSLASFRQRES